MAISHSSSQKVFQKVGWGTGKGYVVKQTSVWVFCLCLDILNFIIALTFTRQDNCLKNFKSSEKARVTHNPKKKLPPKDKQGRNGRETLLGSELVNSEDVFCPIHP